MTLRVALATCAAFPDLDDDGPALLSALAAEGLDVSVHAWDAAVDWTVYDLVVIRCTWDYTRRLEEFLAWTRTVPRLANSAEVLAWNTDKTYLRRLEQAGIPIVPTTWLESGDVFTPPAVPFVVKPTVSAGARDTAAYPAGDETAIGHVEALLAAGRPVMVQPYQSQVDERGETAVLVFGGAVSHGARKGAVLEIGCGEPDLVARWNVGPREPTADETALAGRVVEVVQGWGADLLYARVDLLPGPVLIELEVTEPALFLQHGPGSAQRFARAVRERASAGGASWRS